MILDTIAGSKFSYDAGVSGAVTVPAGVQVTRVMCIATAAGAMLTIAPGGANQPAPPVAGASIAIPVEGGWFGLAMLCELGPGSVFTFTGTASYLVTYAKS